ncbi:MAG: CaiB/BaiF CoA transferase family protein [Gemmatimonadaceae bacterium]
MLHGVRVLDLSRVLAGPVCGMTLGDLGADVIKVERPGLGDESRGWGPPFDTRGESAYYLCCNRNKLGVAINLDVAEDRQLLVELIRGADVVLDNFKRGTLEERGIDPTALLRENHRLIWCTLTGFGPESDRLGYDFVVQAESGWMSITGEPDGTPMKTGVALADVLAGKDAAISVLGALAGRGLGRTQVAEQRRLFVSLAHSASAALVNVAQNYLVDGGNPKRWGNAHPNLVPYQLFRTADRHLVVAVGNDTQWQSCCRALDLPHLGSDPGLITNSGRLANRGRVVEEMARRVAQESAEHWITLLDREGVPCGIIRSVSEALATVSASALTGVAPSVPGSVRLPPPRLDEHGSAIRARGWGAFGAGGA